MQAVAPRIPLIHTSLSQVSGLLQRAVFTSKGCLLVRSVGDRSSTHDDQLAATRASHEVVSQCEASGGARRAWVVPTRETERSALVANFAGNFAGGKPGHDVPERVRMRTREMERLWSGQVSGGLGTLSEPRTTTAHTHTHTHTLHNTKTQPIPHRLASSRGTLAVCSL